MFLQTGEQEALENSMYRKHNRSVCLTEMQILIQF